MRWAPAISGFLLAAATAAAQPEHDPLAGDLGDGRVITGATARRMVLFTFDDGPDPVNTPRLLDLLDERGVRAVFFIVARGLDESRVQAPERAELLREIARRGHVVGAHGWDHASLDTLNPRELHRQLDQSERVFERILGGRPRLFRPPFGLRTRRSDEVLAQRGYTQMLWNLATGDFQLRRARDVLTIFRRSLRRHERHGASGGGIVILHDTHRHSVDAFPRIHDELLARNCQYLARNEELYDVIDHPRVFHHARGGAAPTDTAPPADLPSDTHSTRQAALREATIRRCRPLATR
jgi:peptidoglycan/xylan/chitin deacetylase (PgdA/CDA1 family)